MLLVFHLTEGQDAVASFMFGAKETRCGGGRITQEHLGPEK
jgi:hypothetical protein